jgi:hypothetical protein
MFLHAQRIEFMTIRPGCLLLMGLCVFMTVGCRTGTDMGREPSVLIGRIQMVGNEPFAVLAVETREGDVFVLRCEEDLARYLQENQGRSFRLTCTPGDLTPQGRSLKVIRAEALPREEQP